MEALLLLDEHGAVTLLVLLPTLILLIIIRNRSRSPAVAAPRAGSASSTAELGPSTPGEGRARRHAAYKARGLVLQFDGSVRTTFDMFQRSVDRHPRANCLGRRVPGADGVPGPYEWLTYEEVAARRDAFGRGLMSSSAEYGLRDLLGKRGARVGIYSGNRPEWVICDLACQAFGWISVALYDTLGNDAVAYITDHAEIAVVVVDGKLLGRLVAAGSKSLRVAICMTKPSQADVDTADRLGVSVVDMQTVEAAGRKTGAAGGGTHHVPPAPEDIYTIMYTSGTTGSPKGVVLTHRNIISVVSGILLKEVNLFGPNDVHMSYLPLAHSFERVTVFTMLAVGAQIGFFQGIITELFNDIAELRPTYLVGAPRVWTRLHDKIMLALQASRMKQFLFRRGFTAKLAAMNAGSTSPFWDRLLFRKTALKLGGRVRFILSGSAPLDPKLGQFLEIVFCTKVLEGYGLTENAAGAFITSVSETTFGNVGCPLPCVEAKLVDVPEMNYFSTSQPPRGEILLRGPNVFTQYYRDPVKTEEVFASGGWFRTGDIGRWNPDGTLSIIDRKKNIFKLSQGEYVAVEYLEGVYSRSPFVKMIWVYGNSFKPFLVAVVVPDDEYTTEWRKRGGRAARADLHASIMRDLTRVAVEGRLHGFEHLKAIHVENEEFSVTNNLMTPTHKLRRTDLLDNYQAVVDRMYQQLGV